MVRRVDERYPEEPQFVEVEHEGYWWPGLLDHWALWDDGLGWRGYVTWTRAHEWGPGRHVSYILAHRLRPRE